MSNPPRLAAQRSIPDKAGLDGLEAKWIAAWEREGTYRFERPATRDEVFAIDTPPPTVSGSLHVGHMFSFTHTDCIARYRRMAGQAVFYPMGWDDNGVPTERRVENYFGVRCDATVAYDPAFRPPEVPAKDRRDFIAVNRQNFISLCHQLTEEDEKAFEDLFRRLGLSVDWNLSYATIDDHCRRVSQRAFLRNFSRGEAYQADAPTMWDTTFQMAVSQAELEDKDRPGAFHDLTFTLHGPDGPEELAIATTRPELLASCVAVVAHPDDTRYSGRFGSTVSTPLFGVEVPLLAHPLADPEKGTGAAMVCTFGDLTDVIWWRELNLPARALLGKDGRFSPDVPGWITDEDGRRRYNEFAGRTSKQARRAAVELLRETGELRGEPRPINHAVKFYEKGDQPLEIVQSRQWYIRNGGRDQSIAQALIARGNEVTWHPAYMQARYTNWIEGLNGDWLISRQRYFGVPIPVWYRLDSDGNVDLADEGDGHVLTPSEADLPIDPQIAVPAGYTEDQRGKPGGFVGDADVMDTWATSSLTPQIACGWEEDPELFALTFPMDMRPQGHDIIRTWLFATMVRSHFEADSVPWTNAALSGWILDPDRKKMSKSKGNVVVPAEHLDQHGSDAVRYWAASGRPGTDTAFDEKQMKVGRRLAIKLLNASRFALSLGDGPAVACAPEDRHPVDAAMLTRLTALVDTVTRAFDDFDYARGLERTEEFFWDFCDNHLELVKIRAYGEGAEAVSARAALESAVSVLVRLFAPILPFATEEVWSWWMDGSVHNAAWPTVAELDATGADGVAAAQRLGALTARILADIRRAKTEAKVGMKTPVTTARLTLSAEEMDTFTDAAADLAAAGGVQEWDVSVGDEYTIDVVLG